MTGLRQHLYAAIIRLHPASFRHDFGREMLLDFDEALPASGFLFLSLDALRSVARQWFLTVFPAALERPAVARPSLLAGDYVTLSLGGPDPSRLALATLLSTSFFLALTVTLTVFHTPPAANTQTGLADSVGHSYAYGHTVPGSSQSARQRFAASTDIASANQDALASPLTRTIDMTSPFSGRRHLGGTGTRSMPAGPSLPWHLESWIVLANLAWHFACLWMRNAPIARRFALAILGALAVLAPAASGLMLAAPSAQATLAAAPLPSFEVVSIRPWQRPNVPVAAPPPPSPGTSAPRPSNERFVPIPGPIRSSRIHLILPTRMLIAGAYGIPFGSESRVLGGPDWLDSDQFEIDARIDDALFATLHTQSTTEQRLQLALMERSLLADRFKLQAHTEAKIGPVYDLVVAKGGPRLSPSKEGETPRLSLVDIGGAFRMTAVAIPLNVWLPSPFMGGRTIVDKTGLKGTWDFQLTWRPAQLGGVENDLAPDQPPLLEAIQEQLGLKLVESKGPIEMVVIDHIERPSAN